MGLRWEGMELMLVELRHLVRLVRRDRMGYMRSEWLMGLFRESQVLREDQLQSWFVASAEFDLIVAMQRWVVGCPVVLLLALMSSPMTLAS